MIDVKSVNEEFKAQDMELCSLSDFAIKFESFDNKEKVEKIQTPVYNAMQVLQVDSNGKPEMETIVVNVKEKLENLIFLSEEFGFKKSKVGNQIQLTYENSFVKINISDDNPKLSINVDSLWNLVVKKAVDLKQKRG